MVLQAPLSPLPTLSARLSSRELTLASTPLVVFCVLC